MKIFGDVFESLIAAVFIDSQSLAVTKKTVLRIIKPYIERYFKQEMKNDHPRNKL